MITNNKGIEEELWKEGAALSPWGPFLCAVPQNSEAEITSLHACCTALYCKWRVKLAGIVRRALWQQLPKYFRHFLFWECTFPCMCKKLHTYEVFHCSAVGSNEGWK